MSHPFTLLIGPYAEWRVRQSMWRAGPVDEEPWYEAVISSDAFYLGDDNGLPREKVGRITYVVFRFMPNENRPDRPPRQMAFHYGRLEGDCEDWSWVDLRAEMDWFTEAFAAELAILAEHFGESAKIAWGAVLTR